MSEKKCEIRPKFLIGERVLWLGSGSGLPKSGQVRWIGRLLEIGPNLAVGLELDEPLPYGGIDGTWGTRRLFSCESKHGLIVPSSSVIPQPQHRGSLPSEKKDKTSTLTSQLINKVHNLDTEGRSPVAPRRRHAPKTLPRQIKLFERTPQTDNNGQTFRRMNREFRISEEHLETSSSISSRSCGSKRDRTSGIFSFFKWFKKDSRSFDSDDFDSPPLPGSPILKRGNGPVGSVDTLFSTATTNSFAFIPPSYYRPFGSANQPEIRIALGPETNTYKNRIKHLRKFEQNISLIEKYKLYESGTLPRSVDRINEIREYPKSESESKNSSIKRKKRKAPPPPLTLSENCLPEAQNKENLWKHRRALSEPEATTLKIHVKGKRKAPQPPVFKDGTLSLTRKKRPAPPPPKIDEISKIIKDASFEIIKSDTASNGEIEVLSTDTLKLERGVLKPNKSTMAEPKYSPSSPVSPRPWYKRNTPKETVIWKLDKKKPREYNDTFLESGFPRKYNSGDKFVNIFSKVDKPEDKRKSQISILTNISELDREAAEIVKKNKEKEQEALAAVNKSFYPQAELDQMVHRVVLDEAEIRIVDNQIAKIEELDEYDRNTKPQTLDAKNKPPVIQEASESSAKSTCSSASSSTYESTTSKPEIKYNGGLVWVCARCTLENCRWKITCAACDAWRPSPCEFREKTKTEEKTEKTINTEFLDKTSQLVENISKGLNMSKMMEKDQGSLNQIDKQAEEVRLARLAFFDKQKNVESSESETDKQQTSEKQTTVQSSENILFEKQHNRHLESTNNQKSNISSELTNFEKRKNIALESTSYESEKNESEPEKVNNLTLNYKKDIEKEKDVAKSIEECRQILQNIRVTQQKQKDAEASKVVNTEEKEEKISESNISDYSKITNCINAFPTKEVNKNDFAVPGTSAAVPGTSKVTGGAIPKVKEIQKESFKKPLPPLKITEESLKMEKDNKTEMSVQTTQVDKPKNVSQDIEESRRMLKEMLKEMKHSLPKRPESKKVKDEKPFQHSNDVAEAYLIESETIIEEIKLRKPSEKVSSSAQTSAMVRQIVPKVKPPSGAQIIVPMTVEEHQIKDGVLYTSVNKQAKKIGTATFELLRPRDFANIEAVKKNKAVPPLYVNVEPDELKTLSEQLTQPQGIANFKAELDDASAMNTMAVNRLLKRLESAIANGQLELAAVLAKELAQMKVNCSVTRQKPGPVSKHIVVELYIEDKHNHRGPFPLRVSPKMSLADLKKQVEVEYDLPCDVQRWILGKNLANDDSATLESMGVDVPKKPIFLYLVVPEGKVQDVEEDKEEEKTKEVDIKINLEVKENQIPVVRDIPIQIINEPSDEEDNEGIEEISNPEIEIVEPITPLQDEAKQFPFGTLALGWKCKQCTLINRPTRVDCAACGIKKPSEYKVPVEYQVTEDEKKENYQKLMDLEKDDLIVPLEEFECPICLVRYESNDGVILRECLHVFCRGCLANTVEYSEEAEVKCPYRDDIYTCDSTLLEREIKSLVTPQVYEGHLAKSIALAETKIGNTFHCKTPDCKGWCIYEDNVNLFKCPVCTHTNCLTCQAVHEGLNCKQYQEQVNLDSETNVDSKRTKEMLQEMVDRGEAMNCPTCQVVLMKKWGCDWLRCSMCKTEICWITRGPRWGPNGKGDTTGGCQCGVNGIKCHPKCTYCH